MSSLLVTLPVSFLLSAALLWLVIRAVRSGSFDDWEGPAERHLYDDDRTPEFDAAHFELPRDDSGE
jgi:cbb3-type cytochrome oxidase maturation protein